MSIIKTAVSHASHIQFHLLSSPHYTDAFRGGVFRLFDSKKTKSKQKWNSRKGKRKKKSRINAAIVRRRQIRLASSLNRLNLSIVLLRKQGEI